MRWYHAVIVAAGLAASGALAGGIYDVKPGPEGMPERINRLTGSVEVLPSHALLNAVQSRTDGWVTLESSLPNRSESALPKSTADELLEQRANVSRGSWWVPRWEPVARKAAAKTAADQMKESPAR